MTYSNKIRKKAGAFANAIQNDDIKLFLQAQARYMSPENQVILFNFINDFEKEYNICEKFANWLKQKAIVQHKLNKKLN